MSPADLRAVLDGAHSPDEGSSLAGIAEYYDHVSDDPEFETSVIPVGEGIFASVRLEAKLHEYG